MKVILACHQHYCIVLFNADIDECSVYANLCERVCVDTEGSFNCTCGSGYTVFGRTCTGRLQ